MTVVVAALPAFLASVVEFVEALTMLAVGVVTGQRQSTLVGVGIATMALTLVVVVGAGHRPLPDASTSSRRQRPCSDNRHPSDRRDVSGRFGCP